MNRLSYIVIMILLSSLLFATAGGPDYFNVRGVASNDVLWMHPSPNYKSKRIGQIPYNATCLQNLGYEHRWYKVSYKGVQGWVNGKFLGEAGNCPPPAPKTMQRRFTKEMLKGVVLQTRQYGSALTLTFLPSIYPSFDGSIVFHFASNPPDDKEVLSYTLQDGALVYYGNDGSKTRWTLQNTSPSSWSILEEEDIDGDDTLHRFSNPTQKIYKVITQSVPSLKQPEHTVNTPANREIERYDKEIYNTLDQQLNSNRNRLKSINRFIYTASLLLIKKHKLDIQMEEIRQHQMAAQEIPAKTKAIIHSHQAMETLNGKTYTDHHKHELHTLSQLKQAYGQAIKESIRLQKDCYALEKRRAFQLAELEDALKRSGSKEQKKTMKEREVKKAQEAYRYYKKLLDSSSVWCLSDKGNLQSFPLFFPKYFFIERLYKQYTDTLLHTHASYDAKAFSVKVEKLKTRSQKIKHQFNQNYLYDLRMKPSRIQKMF